MSSATAKSAPETRFAGRRRSEPTSGTTAGLRQMLATATNFVGRSEMTVRSSAARTATFSSAAGPHMYFLVI